jgi:hypothetical protein
LRIIGDQSYQVRIRPRMRERGEHGDLGDMSQADHGITHPPAMFRVGHF